MPAVDDGTVAARVAAVNDAYLGVWGDFLRNRRRVEMCRRDVPVRATCRVSLWSGPFLLRGGFSVLGVCSVWFSVFLVGTLSGVGVGT